MIKNVVFDIGCVLIGFDWDAYVRRLFDQETAEVVTACAFKCPFWKEMDRGEMEQPEILARMIEQSPEYAEQIRESVVRVDECVERTDYAIPWIESLKARGYRVLYLSNYSDWVMSKSGHALDFLEHMNGGIFSYKVHCIKPDEEIYRILFDRYDLVPEECVFIDDTPANIETAKRLGMEGVIFENYDQAKTELEGVLNYNM